MKIITFVLFIFCSTCKFSVLGQVLTEKNIPDKVNKEIAYIMDCIKTNRKVDSLKEWKLEGKNERGIYYKDKRGRYVAFLLHKDTSGIYLKKISYQIASHQIKVFSNNSLNEYKINDKTHFTVWTSKKDHVFYFCMINPSNIVIWILKNHQTLYIFNSTL